MVGCDRVLVMASGLGSCDFFCGSVKRFTLGYGPKGLESTRRPEVSDDRKVVVR
jgi:hypothetical protein